jgi:hypothetical protein
VFTFNNGGAGYLPDEEEVYRTGLPPFLIRIIRFFVRIFFKIINDKNVNYQLADAIIGSLGGLLLLAPKVRKAD